MYVALSERILLTPHLSGSLAADEDEPAVMRRPGLPARPAGRGGRNRRGRAGGQGGGELRKVEDPLRPLSLSQAGLCVRLAGAQWLRKNNTTGT